TLANAGTGENYGIDLSLDKSFSNDYYFLVNASIYRSSYTNYAGQTFSTKYDRGFHTNLVAGKEFPVGNAVLGLNLKLVLSGGLRESPIDIERSRQSLKTEYRTGEY